MYERRCLHGRKGKPLYGLQHPDDNDELFVGVGGTVCGEDQGGSYWVPVCWDIMTERGHDCNGECEFGYGWNVSREDIVPEKIREIRDADIAELSDICSFIGIGRCEA